MTDHSSHHLQLIASDATLELTTLSDSLLFLNRLQKFLSPGDALTLTHQLELRLIWLLGRYRISDSHRTSLQDRMNVLAKALGLRRDQ